MPAFEAPRTVVPAPGLHRPGPYKNDTRDVPGGKHGSLLLALASHYGMDQRRPSDSAAPARLCAWRCVVSAAVRSGTERRARKADELKDRIKAAVDFEALVSETASVTRRAGNTLKARCPFHDDSTPSLSVTLDKGLWHCFGCHRGGDVFDWVQETHGTDFKGSLRWLAERNRIPMDDESRRRRPNADHAAPAQRRSQRSSPTDEDRSAEKTAGLTTATPEASHDEESVVVPFRKSGGARRHEERPPPTASEKETPLLALTLCQAVWHHEKLLGEPGAEGGRSDRAVGRRARKFLADRGYTKPMIDLWGIGFCPEGWTLGAQGVGEVDQISDAEWSASGLGQEDRTPRRTYFGGRVVFPIRDLEGRTTAFGGRVLPGSTDTRKFVNSRGCAVYDKSKTLYGLYEAKEAILRSRTAMICEGYTDVHAAHALGHANAVAPCGTALTAAQVRRLLQLGCMDLWLAFDSDDAGRKAAERSGTLAWEKMGVNVEIISLTREDVGAYLAPPPDPAV